MYSIYTLIDPRTNQVRYVGISSNVEQRYHAHLHTDPHNATKQAWIQELKSDQLVPRLAIIETGLEVEVAKKHELQWIRHHLEQGMPLVNISGVTQPWNGGIRAKSIRYTKPQMPKIEEKFPQLYTVRQVAQQLQKPEYIIKRYIKQGVLSATKMGRAYRITEKDIARFWANLKQQDNK